MTKVCMIVHKDYFRDTRVKRYAEALADAGIQVDVICPQGQNPSSTKPRSSIKVFAIPLGHGEPGRGGFLLEYGAAFVFYSLWLLALHIKNRYQLIHVHNMPDFLVFAALIPRLLGAKLILDIHDPTPEFYTSKYHSEADRLPVRLMRLQEKLSTSFAHAVITANSNFRDNLVKRGVPNNKVTVVNNLPDPAVFNRSHYLRQRRAEGAQFRLLYPGTIAPRYGLGVAIRALPELIKTIPEIRLVIIGTQTEHVKELVALAKELSVLPFVEFIPTLPVEEIPRQMSLADIGIYPALPDAHMNIATPTKVLEYAVMGLPIIASRLKIIEDLFTDASAMLFDPGNVDQFASYVLELYGNSSRGEALVQNADKLFVQTHAWSNERQAYFSLIKRLLPACQEMIVSD